MLVGINQHRHRDVAVPHGFQVERISPESRPNLFSRLPEVWVQAQLKVPVIYSSKPLQNKAQLPASRDNLDALQRWVENDA